LGPRTKLKFCNVILKHANVYFISAFVDDVVMESSQVVPGLQNTRARGEGWSTTKEKPWK